MRQKIEKGMERSKRKQDAQQMNVISGENKACIFLGRRKERKQKGEGKKREKEEILDSRKKEKIFISKIIS